MLPKDNLSNKKPVVKPKSAPKVRKYIPQAPVWRGTTKEYKRMVKHQLDNW